MRMGEPVAEFGSWQAEALAEEKAKLAGGFRVGERVVSLIDHALMGVARGDVGTAVGPCEAMNGWSPSDNAARLSVDFGEGKGRVNLLDKDTVSEAEWPKHRKEDEAKVFAAGGWRIGDRVLSVIKHKPCNIKVGDLGTVVGPSEGADKDARERVRVDFGKKKGVVNGRQNAD